jgi:putative GTP pyrophosphokinase
MNADEELAVQTLWAYRASFAYPTTKINANLRHYVKKANCDILIAQRMKRLPRILEKLHRHPRMRMSQMQDVGGCRAILPSQSAVYDVAAGLARNWDIVTSDDYVTEPRPTGYRALHVIVKRDGRPIEVQLRTIGQQDWADEIERLDGKYAYGLKVGEGPSDVLEYTRLFAELIWTTENGQTINRESLQRLRHLRETVAR